MRRERSSLVHWRSVVQLRRAFGHDLRIVTTNYDQLLVSALRSNGTPAARSYCTNSQQAGVIHLHGVIGHEQPADGRDVVVLTESDYLAPVGDGWRVDVMRSTLERPCLFLGTSMTDLNILTRLHNARSPQDVRHYVIFARPAFANDSEEARHATLEGIEQRRWKALGVTPLFASNFADVAQIAFELAASPNDALD